MIFFFSSFMQIKQKKIQSMLPCLLVFCHGNPLVLCWVYNMLMLNKELVLISLFALPVVVSLRLIFLLASISFPRALTVFKVGKKKVTFTILISGSSVPLNLVLVLAHLVESSLRSDLVLLWSPSPLPVHKADYWYLTNAGSDPDLSIQICTAVYSFEICALYKYVRLAQCKLECDPKYF